jgi:hypothetical protein
MTEDNRGEVHSRIDRIEVTLTHAVEAIEKMAKVVNKPQDVKWGPILTAVTLLILVMGGYITLVTQPMQQQVTGLEAQIYVLHENEMDMQRELGRIEGRLGVVIPDE